MAALDALLERPIVRGEIENHVLQITPQRALVLALDDADRALELLAYAPQLAVEGMVGKALGEPATACVLQCEPQANW